MAGEGTRAQQQRDVCGRTTEQAILAWRGRPIAAAMGCFPTAAPHSTCMAYHRPAAVQLLMAPPTAARLDEAAAG